MPVTVRDICGNADVFRSAYPSWPHPEPERTAPSPVLVVPGRHAGGQTDSEQVLEDRWRDAL